MMRRAVILVTTNVGGQWILPIAERMVKEGVAVTCLLAREDGDLDEHLAAKGCTVRKLSMDKHGVLALLRSLFQIRGILKEEQPDLLIYYLFKASMIARLSSLGLGLKRVNIVVGPVFLEVRVLRRIEAMMCRFDTHIIAGSHAIRLLYHGLGRREGISVVYPPVDYQRFSPAPKDIREALRSEMSLDQNEFVAVMVSYWYAAKRPFLNQSHLKGHDVALKAWRRYREAGGTGKFVIVGGGFREAGEEYRRQALMELGHLIDDSVLVLGSVENVPDYYAIADMSLAPSRTENLGSAAEAAGMAVPTIASSTGGLPELVVPGFSGWLAPPGDVDGFADALLEAACLHENGRLAPLGLKARDLACAMLSQELVAEKMLATLRKVAAR